MDSAGSSPVAGSVEAAMPFQSPKLLKADLPYRPIHKNTVNETLMPIDAEMRHPAFPGLAGMHILVFRRPVHSVRPACRQQAVQKQRDIACAFNKYGFPTLMMPTRGGYAPVITNP